MLSRRQTTANSCSLLGIQHGADGALLSNRPFPSMSSVGIGQQVHLGALPQGNPTLSAGETDCEKTIDPQ